MYHSYQNLKIVHEQQVHEVIEHQYLSTKRDTSNSTLRHAFGTFFASLIHSFAPRNSDHRREQGGRSIA